MDNESNEEMNVDQPGDESNGSSQINSATPPTSISTDGGGSPPLLPPPPSEGLSEGSPQPESKSYKTPLIIAAAVLLLLIVGGVVAVALGGSDSKKSATSTTQSTVSQTTISSTTTTRLPTTTTTTTPAPMLTKAMCQDTAASGQFIKDSSSLKGTCLHFWAYVFQFDSNTGKCSLLANYGDSPARYNFDYKGGIVRIDGGSGPGKVVTSNQGRVQLPPDSCVQLGPITEGDRIEVWGIDLGVESYSTKMGGSNSYTIIGLVDAYKI